MSYVTVYNCDGPACLESHDESEESLVEAGWFTLEFEEEDETNVAHLCSSSCLEQWAAERVPAETNG